MSCLHFFGVSQQTCSRVPKLSTHLAFCNGLPWPPLSDRPSSSHTVPNDLAILQDHINMSSLDVTPSRIAPRGRDPAQGVYYKLAFFSVALFAAPLSAYYFAKDRYFGGESPSFNLFTLR